MDSNVLRMSDASLARLTTLLLSKHACTHSSQNQKISMDLKHWRINSSTMHQNNVHLRSSKDQKHYRSPSDAAAVFISTNPIPKKEEFLACDCGSNDGEAADF
eukprot:901150_1